MDKQQQFILMVQTGLILYYAKKGEFDTTCAFWAVDHLAEAIKASQRIPEDADTAEAASSFLRWVLRTENYSEEDYREWFEEVPA